MKIAIVGFGVVGSGAYEASRSVDNLEVTAVLNRGVAPGYEYMADLFKDSIDDIVNDPEIELVVEAIGGVELPREYVLKCLNAGKHVVTPNKNLISACYEELSECARANGVKIAFTPSSGGGIPWLFNLRRTRRTDRISEVRGIVNGTCNYILDAMHKCGASFDDMLAKAKELGYAESNPSADIDGLDTLRKTVISANTAFGTTIRESDVPCFGIRSITADDVSFFSERGLTCRLMMNATHTGDSVSAYVEPVLFARDALEASVETNNNLITLVGDCVGTLSFYGQGAGKMPTGQSVIQDVLDIRDNVSLSCLEADADLKVDNSSAVHRYYVRCSDILPCIENFCDSVSEFRGSYRVITKPVSVAKMHEAAREMKEEGLAFFFAGMGE
ncbi:MAG: homoserine dehydrogenase [Firmicutes bacterium]|nr:homoserine dehydrogenase [Bacillota bacterium]